MRWDGFRFFSWERCRAGSSVVAIQCANFPLPADSAELVAAAGVIEAVCSSTSDSDWDAAETAELGAAYHSPVPGEVDLV